MLADRFASLRWKCDNDVEEVLLWL